MFIAAFVAGLAMQLGFKPAGQHSVDFAAARGQLINLSVFFLFGLMVGRNCQHFTVAHAVSAGLSQTVVRMLPVAEAIIGPGLSWAAMLFMGWFGPRRLASIVVGLVCLEPGAQHPGTTTIRLASIVTGLLRIFAHGQISMLGIKLHAARIATLPAGVPNLRDTKASRNDSDGEAAARTRH